MNERIYVYLGNKFFVKYYVLVFLIKLEFFLLLFFSAFDKQTVKTYIRRNMDSFDWRSYFRLDDIYNWLQDLNRMHPKSMQLQSIGKTKEKRDILAARIVVGSTKNK